MMKQVDTYLKGIKCKLCKDYFHFRYIGKDWRVACGCVSINLRDAFSFINSKGLSFNILKSCYFSARSIDELLKKKIIEKYTENGRVLFKPSKRYKHWLTELKRCLKHIERFYSDNAIKIMKVVIEKAYEKKEV